MGESEKEVNGGVLGREDRRTGGKGRGSGKVTWMPISECDSSLVNPGFFLTPI